MILSGIIVIGIFLFCIILMVATGTPEKLDYMPIGFKYLPISFVFNMTLFSGQLLLISVTFKRHLKNNPLKTVLFGEAPGGIALSILAIVFYQQRGGWEFLIRPNHVFHSFLIATFTVSSTLAVCFYLAWQQKKYWTMFPAFLLLVIIHSFTITYCGLKF